jgi:hypothetical protein
MRQKRNNRRFWAYLAILRRRSKTVGVRGVSYLALLEKSAPARSKPARATPPQARQR